MPNQPFADPTFFITHMECGKRPRKDLTHCFYFLPLFSFCFLFPNFHCLPTPTLFANRASSNLLQWTPIHSFTCDEQNPSSPFSVTSLLGSVVSAETGIGHSYGFLRSPCLSHSLPTVFCIFFCFTWVPLCREFVVWLRNRFRKVSFGLLRCGWITRSTNPFVMDTPILVLIQGDGEDSCLSDVLGNGSCLQAAWWYFRKEQLEDFLFLCIWVIWVL